MGILAHGLASYGRHLRDVFTIRLPLHPPRMTRLGEILHAAMDWTLRYPLGRSQWIILGAWYLLLAGGMIEFGDRITSTTNVDPEAYDQGAYVRVAEQNRSAWWPTVTDGIRNPLFPWLLAKIGGSGNDSMFADGLRLNVRLGAILVVLLGCWAGRRVAILPALMFVTIASAIVLPVSTYVGTEVLFYGLFFAAWMLAFALYERLTLLRCVLFGATLGLAYLAKPGVTLLTGSFIAVGLTLWLGARRTGEALGWAGMRPLLGAALATLVFAATILPRALNSWGQFRDPLQNTAARCFWAEDWNACYPILGLLNPRLIERVPDEERPSAGRYIARHGWSGMWNRLARGIAVQADNVFSPDQKSIWFGRKPSEKRPVRRLFPYRGFFLLPPAALAIGLWIAAGRRFGEEIVHSAAPWQTSFALLLVGASFAAFSWYSVIAPGARFIVALYLPVLASLMLAAEALRRRLAARWSDGVAGGMWLLMFAAIATHLVVIATHPYFDKLKGAF
jgi:hypothetical protein